MTTKPLLFRRVYSMNTQPDSPQLVMYWRADDFYIRPGDTPPEKVSGYPLIKDYQFTGSYIRIEKDEVTNTHISILRNLTINNKIRNKLSELKDPHILFPIFENDTFEVILETGHTPHIDNPNKVLRSSDSHVGVDLVEGKYYLANVMGFSEALHLLRKPCPLLKEWKSPGSDVTDYTQIQKVTLTTKIT